MILKQLLFLVFSPKYYRMKPLYGVDARVSDFPVFVVCCISLKPCSVNVNQTKSLAISKLCEVGIIISCVNITGGGQATDVLWREKGQD